jgi:uncharacterized protein involved in outer membrane biogenesis
MPRWLKVSFSVFSIVLLGLLALPWFLNLDRWKDPLLTQAEKTLGRPLVIKGGVSVSFLPYPTVTAQDVSIASIPGAKHPQLVTIQTVQVAPQIWALLKGQVVLDQVKVKDVKLFLETLPDGRQSWHFPFLDSEIAQEESFQKEASSQPTPKRVMIHALKVRGAEVHWITPGKKPFHIQDMDVNVAMDSPQGPFTMEGSVKVWDTPLTLQAEMPSLESKDPVTFALTGWNQRLEGEGVLDLKTQRFQGDLKLKGQVKDLQRLTSIDVPEVLQHPYKIKGTVDMGVSLLTVSALDITCGNMSAVGSATFKPDSLETVLALTLNPGKAQVSVKTLSLEDTLFSAKVSFKAKELKTLLHALKVPVDEIPSDVLKDLSLETVIDWHQDQVMLRDLVFVQGPAQVSGNLICKTHGAESGYEYDLKTPHLLALMRLIDPHFSHDMGAVHVKGTTTGTLANLKTDTHVITSVAALDLAGTLGFRKIAKGFALQYQLKTHAKGPSLNQLSRVLGKGSVPVGRFSVDAELDGDQAQLVIKDLKADLGMGKGSLDMTGTGDISFGPVRPKIKASLRFGKIDMPGLLAHHNNPVDVLVPQFYLVSQKTPEGPLPKHSTRWSHEKIDLSGLRNLDADIALSAQEVIFDTLTVSKMQGSLHLVNGVLEVPTLKANTSGGALTLKMRLSSQEGQPLDLKFHLTDADLKTFGPKDGQLKITQGKVSLSADLHSRGSSQFQYVKNLSGDVALHAREGVLSGLNLQKISQKLGQMKNPGDVVSLIGASFKGGETRFQSLDSSLKVDAGVGRINTFTLACEGLNMNAEGKINLLAYTLNMLLIGNFIEAKQFPPFKVRLYGSLDNIQHDIDASKLTNYMVQHVFGDILKNALKKGGDGPQGLIKGLLGLPGQKEKTAPAPAPSDQSQGTQPSQPADDILTKPEKAIGNILKGIFK